MNLPLARDLLRAAEEQPYGFLRVRGYRLAHEVELMAGAHLVQCTVGNGNGGEPWAVINRVTELGHKFVRSLRGVPFREANGEGRN